MNSQIKDVAELHKADPNKFEQRWEEAKEKAFPLSAKTNNAQPEGDSPP